MARQRIWQTSLKHTYLDQQKTSLVYVHGNRTDEVFARSRGLQFYENTFNGEMCSGPIRFIIYAWRSEREKVRVGPDFRIKLDRSVAIGPMFACFVNQFEDRRLILSGFSLGAQVVLSGLVELQAANDLEPKSGRYRIALITPALQACDSLVSVAPLPFNSVAAETDVFTNKKDIALIAAKVSEKKNKQMPAVTLEQLAQQSVPGTTNRIVIEDMTNCVSRYHSISRYSARSCRLRTGMNRMADELRCEAGVMVPQCDQWQSDSIEVIEPVDEVIVELVLLGEPVEVLLAELVLLGCCSPVSLWSLVTVSDSNFKKACTNQPRHGWLHVVLPSIAARPWGDSPTNSRFRLGLRMK